MRFHGRGCMCAIFIFIVIEIMEYFPLVDEQGNVLGKASREECHSGSFLLHPVVHLHVFNEAGELYLQKRSLKKDIQPGKWDTAVGGHVGFGEDVWNALLREAREELGMCDFEPEFMNFYKYVSDRESELVYCFRTVYRSMPVPDRDEVDEGRFWSMDEIRSNIGKGVFTPNFEQEFEKTVSRWEPLS